MMHASAHTECASPKSVASDGGSHHRQGFAVHPLLALQRTVGNAAVSRLVGPPRSPDDADPTRRASNTEATKPAVKNGALGASTMPYASGSVAAAGATAIGPIIRVQRAVGFEFETGWMVSKADQARTPLKKKDPIGPPRDGFKLEADEAGGGESEVEFIVHPPVAEGEQGAQRLDDVMTSIEVLGSSLEGVGRHRPRFNFGEVTGRLDDAAYLITPTPDRQLQAGPQVTSGLDLAKIEDLSPKAERRQDPITKEPMGGAAQAPHELQGSLGQLSTQASKMRPFGVPLKVMSPALKGLLAVITTYLNNGANKYKGQELPPDVIHAVALSYPKQIGDVLLARTNFAQLFRLLHPWEQHLIKRTRDGWITLVLNNTGNEYRLTKHDSVIGRGVRLNDDDYEDSVDVPSLTIEDWLTGILDEVDLLTEIGDAESMGEFKNRTESVGGTTGSLFDTPRPVGIFEFRGAQAQKIPLARWKPFATEFHKFITTVHAD